jgi:hypothetical protein
MSADLPTNSHQAWNLIQNGYTLRLSLVARDWETEHLQAVNAVIGEARKRGNAAYLGPAWVEMELEDMNRRAEWAYKTCCDIWEMQKRPMCRAFYRAVFDWCLAPMFGTRVGCFQAELKMHQMRTRRNSHDGNSRIFAHMNREVMRLRAEWSTKLEIARLDAEQEQLALAREAQQARALAGQGQAKPIDGPVRTSRKALGRRPVRDRQFEALASQLWHQEHEIGKSLGIEGLRRIAQRLDDSGLGKPSEHLETKAAKALREHNRQYGKSPAKLIMTWTALVDRGDKDQRLAMRRLLSRCATNFRK